MPRLIRLKMRDMDSGLAIIYGEIEQAVVEELQEQGRCSPQVTPGIPTIPRSEVRVQQQGRSATPCQHLLRCAPEGVAAPREGDACIPKRGVPADGWRWGTPGGALPRCWRKQWF
jgi:hypothetical protein